MLKGTGGRGRESGELECISGLKQVVHCYNSYQGRRVFKGAGVGGSTEESSRREEVFAANCC